MLVSQNSGPFMPWEITVTIFYIWKQGDFQQSQMENAWPF